jgi:hypothetical protein
MTGFHRMPRALLKAHRILGLLGILVFILSGQYMHWFLQHLSGMPDGPRLLHRTAHIYLAWSSLLNLLLGCYGQFAKGLAARTAQALASLGLMASLPLLALSFLFESNAADLTRPIAAMAVYLSAAGVLVHAGCHRFSQRRAIRADSVIPAESLPGAYNQNTIATQISDLPDRACPPDSTG